MLVALLRVGVVGYLGVVLLSMGLADRMIFVPPRATYGDDLAGLVRLPTASGETIAARWLPAENARAVVLFAHGNGEDIGQGGWHQERYAALGASVLTFDYPGYGLSSGTPSEEGAYAAADAAYRHALEASGLPADRLVAHGRSLGGGVVVDVASRQPVGGLVIESSFVSAYRVMTRVPVLPIDQFRSLAKLPAVTAPTLVVHGERDAIVAPWHGRALYDALPQERRSALWVERAGHNDLAMVAGDEYWDALGTFLQQVIAP